MQCLFFFFLINQHKKQHRNVTKFLFSSEGSELLNSPLPFKIKFKDMIIKRKTELKIHFHWVSGGGSRAAPDEKILLIFVVMFNYFILLSKGKKIVFLIIRKKRKCG